MIPKNSTARNITVLARRIMLRNMEFIYCLEWLYSIFKKTRSITKQNKKDRF